MSPATSWLTGHGRQHSCAESKVEESRAATEAGLALNRAFTISRFRQGAWSNNPAYLAQREHIYVGMLKAGVPEG